MQVRNVYVVVCPRSEVKDDEEAFARRDVELKRQRLKVGVVVKFLSLGDR